MASCSRRRGSGQLGDQTTIDRDTPVSITGPWAAIGAGGESTCGIKTDGTLWCWGRNDRGQLGDGSFYERHVPTRVPQGTNWASVDLGDRHACALTTTGDGACWGASGHGETGDGATRRSTLVTIP